MKVEIPNPQDFAKYPITMEECRGLDQQKTPDVLMGIAVAVLRQHFGCPERITLSGPNKFLWTPDDKSEVWIAEAYHFDLTTVGQRPAIIVELETQQYPQLSTAPLNVESFNPKTGTLNYVAPVNGGWTLHVLSPNYLECWSLAFEVRSFMQTYGPVISKQHGIDRWLVTGLTKPVKEKDYGDRYRSTVFVQHNFLDAWGLTLEALKLKSIGAAFAPRPA